MRLLRLARTGRPYLFISLTIAWSCSSSDRNFGGPPAASGAAGETNAGGADDGGGSSSAGADATAGSSPGADGGAGLAPNSDALSVEAISPVDEATAVERDTPIEVTFSASVDAKTVTAESFSVRGPNGVVAGNLRVAGATVSFSPHAPWSLLATYTVELAASIAGVAAGVLDEAHSYGFRTRDGAFRKPERLSSASPSNFGLAENRQGYAAAYWQTKDATSSVEAAIYDPVAAKWGAATKLELDDANAYDSPRLALNDRGEAVAVFSGPASVLSWNRYDGAKWGSAKTATNAHVGPCALAEDGTATVMWEGVSGNDWQVSAAGLSPADEWATATILGNKARTWALARYGSGHLALFSHEPDYQVFYRISDANDVWAAEKPLTSSGRSANYISLDTLGSNALFTWNDAEGRMQASLFDGSAWTTQDLGPVAGGTFARLGPERHLATWFYQGNAYVAEYAEAKWADPIKLGPTTTDYLGPAAQVDVSGNSLVAWPDGSAVAWRRLPQAAAAWTKAERIEDQDPYAVFSSIDASGNVMLVWSNPLGVWASRFD